MSIEMLRRIGLFGGFARIHQMFEDATGPGLSQDEISETIKAIAITTGLAIAAIAATLLIDTVKSPEETR